MWCIRCGTPVTGTYCGNCGWQAPVPRNISMTISPAEARRGCDKTLYLTDMVTPIRFRIPPRTLNGTRMSFNAMFYNENDMAEPCPVELTIRIIGAPAVSEPVKKRSKWWLIPLIAALLAVIIAAVQPDFSPDLPDSSLSVNQPVQNTPVKDPVQTQPDLPDLPDPTPVTPDTQPDSQPDPEPDTAPDPQPEPQPDPQPDLEPDPEPSRDIRAEAAAQIPYFETRYLLQQLDDRLLENFCAIYEGVAACQAKIALPHKVTTSELYDLTTLLTYECPELFQYDPASGYRYYCDKNDMAYELEPIYRLNKEEYDIWYGKCREVMEPVIRQAQGLSEKEQEMLVYRFIAENSLYSMDPKNADNPYGILVEKIGKCDGFAKTVKWFMDELGITCIAVVAENRNGPIGHSWNVICIDGVWADLDVTEEVPTEKSDTPLMFYIYNNSYNLNRNRYAIYQVFFTYGLPGTDSMDYSYHAENGTLLRADENWSEKLDQLLLDAYNGVGHVVVQFEDLSQFDSFATTMNDYLNGWTQRMNINGWSARSTYKDVLGTICIWIGPYNQ